MISFKFDLKLKTKITLLIILILNIVLILVGVFTVNYFKNIQISRLEKNAKDIAHSVANIPIISKTLHGNGDIEIIQEVAEKIRQKTQASFIVVIDMKGKRYSHPFEDRLGEKIVGGDEKKVLQNSESYLSQAVGTMGLSQRAFVPIFYDNKQVGAVVSGILMDEINQQIANMTNKIIFALLLGDILGIVGSILLAHNIKKSIFGLEPHEIARILEEKNAIIDSIREGIIAINKYKEISLINKQANSILNVTEEVKGENILNVIPNSGLPRILNSKESEYNRDHLINDTIVLTNRVPIIINNKVVGAVASFNKKNEVQELAQRLTGVKKFASALRSQNHEFMNKLHVISGLIQLEEYSNALNLISKFTAYKQQISSLIIEKIKNNEIAGLLLGKIDRSKELGINLTIDPQSYLKKDHNVDLTNSLITIIGNLIENAMESTENQEEKEVYFGIFEKENKLLLIVEDTGCGFNNKIKDKIFERDYSTKNKSSGIGLSLVKENIKSLKGKIKVESKINKGSSFEITIPLNEEENL